jgi:hypothetical protein
MPKRILFVPVSGPGGAGEYYRTLAIANATLARYPHVEVHFVLDRHARYATGSPHRVTLLDDSPTRDSRAVVRCIESTCPDLVVFDNAGRVAQLRAARRVGARAVYISSRWKTRWKGFRLRRMRWLDQHWIIGPSFANPPLSRYESMKLRLFPRLRILQMGTLAEPAAAAAVIERYSLQRGNYVLCCPGGAGRFQHAPRAAEIFMAVARRIARESGCQVLYVGAPVDSENDSVLKVPFVPNADLMALLGAARLCVINGGSLLLQAMAQRAICVAAPIAGDQPARIASLAQRGAIVAADLTEDSLGGAALALLSDDAARRRLHASTAGLLENAIDRAVAEVASLLAL